MRLKSAIVDENSKVYNLLFGFVSLVKLIMIYCQSDVDTYLIHHIFQVQTINNFFLI